MDTTKAELVTRKHQQRVAELLGLAAIMLIQRGAAHDLSKLEPEELEPLQKMQDLVEAEGQAPFGSEEYDRRKGMLGSMLEHHYENNSHHPEHYPEGVNGFDLFDLIEMFMDWKAASERGEESAMHLTSAAERYKLDPQVISMFTNTANRLGFDWK